MHNSEISKKLGKKWLSFSFDEQLPFNEESKRLREQHRRDYPNYKYRPKRKEKGASKKSTAGSSSSHPTTPSTSSRRQPFSMPPSNGFGQIPNGRFPTPEQELMIRMQEQNINSSNLSSPGPSYRFPFPFNPMMQFCPQQFNSFQNPFSYLPPRQLTPFDEAPLSLTNMPVRSQDYANHESNMFQNLDGFPRYSEERQQPCHSMNTQQCSNNSTFFGEQQHIRSDPMNGFPSHSMNIQQCSINNTVCGEQQQVRSYPMNGFQSSSNAAANNVREQQSFFMLQSSNNHTISSEQRQGNFAMDMRLFFNNSPMCETQQPQNYKIDPSQSANFYDAYDNETPVMQLSDSQKSHSSASESASSNGICFDRSPPDSVNSASPLERAMMNPNQPLHFSPHELQSSQMIGGSLATESPLTSDLSNASTVISEANNPVAGYCNIADLEQIEMMRNKFF